MADTMIVLHKEFGPLLNALGKKLAPSGKNSIMEIKDARRKEFGFNFKDKNAFKRLKDDRLLKKLLKNKTDSEFRKTLKNIQKIVSDETKAYHMSTEALSPGDWGSIRKTHSSNVWNKTEKELKSFHDKAYDVWGEFATRYYRERQKGKYEKGKEKLKKAKAVTGATASLMGVVGAFAGTLATFGAAAPGLAGAAYGSYLSCKDAFDTFRQSGKSIDARCKSIDKSLAKLKTEYLDKDQKAIETAMKKREIKAKALRTFLSKNSTTSLKKLGGDLHNLEKALKVSKFSLSKLGRKAGEHVNRLDEVIEYCAKIEKSPLASDIKNVTKQIKKEKLSKDLFSNTEKLKAEAISQKKTAKHHITVTVKSYEKLDALGKQIPEWNQFVEDLNKVRPAAVKNASKIFMGMKIAFQIGAAASSMGASTASFVPDAAKFAITKADSLQGLGQTIVDTAQSIESEFSLARKLRDKLEKKSA